jgi:3-dehydroquinate dehydratase
MNVIIMMNNSNATTKNEEKNENSLKSFDFIEIHLDMFECCQGTIRHSHSHLSRTVKDERA